MLTRYKIIEEQSMAPKLSPIIAAESNRFETALKEARIPEQLHDGIWDVWVTNPSRAHGLIARFKDAGSTPAIRFKAAPDPIEQALNRLRQAAVAAGQSMPDDQIVQQIEQLTMALGQLTNPKAQRQQLATKQAGSSDAPRFVDDFGRPLARPLYDSQGRPLP
jgi:hypothetical protein